VDELTLLRELVVDEPMDNEIARDEVWRRLLSGETQRRATAGRALEESVEREQAPRPGVRARRRRLAILLTAVIAIFVASASAFGVRDVFFGASGRRTFDSPIWSPDGTTISFNKILWDASGDFVSMEVYVINADGSGQRNVTDEWGQLDLDIRPIWSPDWRRIAFVPYACASVKGACVRTASIYVMNADGSELHRIARAGKDKQIPSGQRVGPRAAQPVWSPDGRTIAFGSERDGNVELYVMTPDGSNQRRLTRSPEAEESLAWSPDGRKIAFERTTWSPTVTIEGDIHRLGRPLRHEIYVMNADGSKQQLLARGSAPAWSPDGRRIAFRSARDGNGDVFGIGDVYAVNADGSGLRRLTRNPVAFGSPVWSRNGRRIFFEGGGDIYVTNADGSGQRNMTRHITPARDTADSPHVSPDGRRIVFVIQRADSSQIYVMNADGSGLKKLTHTDG
jgi:Tol biopolymer transport system component